MSDDDFRREVLRNPDGNLYRTSPSGVPAEEAARAELQRRLETVTRVVLRPLASPLPSARLRVPAPAAGVGPGVPVQGRRRRDRHGDPGRHLADHRAGPADLATGIFQLTTGDGWKLVAGWVGVLLFAVAMYAALAGELEDVRGQTALPVGRKAKGKLSVEGTLLDQIMDVHHEPGVRRQL